MSIHLSLALCVTLGAAACAASSPFTPRAAHISPEGARAVAIVRVAKPWYAPRFFVRGKFHAVRAEYERIPELQAKYFTISDEDQFGGVYLWDSRAAAEHHFDAAWHANVRAKRGVEGDVLVMDAPFVIDGRALPTGTPEGTRSLDYRAIASLVRWRLAPAEDPMTAARALASRAAQDRALIRGFVVIGGDTVGIVALCPSREAAAHGIALGAGATTSTLFEAPLLIDASLLGAS